MPSWSSGMAWRVVNGLNKLNEAIRAFAPRAVPPATTADSWGSIADNVHSTSSDHYPHFYGPLGSTAVVCARDFPHAPGLGLDGGIITEHMRLARDSRIQYIIFNRRITGINYGWQWHTYTGDDPHNTHFHVSSVHSAVADSVAAWSLPGSASAASASSAGGLDMIRIMVQGGDGAVWVPGNTPLHIGPNLNADLNTAGVPMCQVDDVTTLNSVLNSQRAVPDDNSFVMTPEAMDQIAVRVVNKMINDPANPLSAANRNALVEQIVHAFGTEAVLTPEVAQQIADSVARRVVDDPDNPLSGEHREQFIKDLVSRFGGALTNG